MECIIHSFWKENEVFSKALKIVLDRNEEAIRGNSNGRENKLDTRIFILVVVLERAKKNEYTEQMF